MISLGIINYFDNLKKIMWSRNFLNYVKVIIHNFFITISQYPLEDCVVSQDTVRVEISYTLPRVHQLDTESNFIKQRLHQFYSLNHSCAIIRISQKQFLAKSFLVSQSNLYLRTVASSGLQKIVIYINKFKIFQAYVTLIFIPVFHECRVYRI